MPTHTLTGPEHQDRPSATDTAHSRPEHRLTDPHHRLGRPNDCAMRGRCPARYVLWFRGDTCQSNATIFRAAHNQRSTTLSSILFAVCARRPSVLFRGTASHRQHSLASDRSRTQRMENYGHGG